MRRGTQWHTVGGRSTGWCRRRRLSAVLLTVLGSLTVPVVTSAHVGPSAGEGVGVDPFFVVVAAATLGSVLGVGSLFFDRWVDRLPGGGAVVARWHRAVGAVLVVVGVTFSVEPLRHSPALAALCVTAGAVAAGVLSRRGPGDAHTARTWFGGGASLAVLGVLGHRTFEGLALGVGIASGSTVGVVGAVAISGHAALESVGVGGSLASGNRLLGALAVLGTQAAFVTGAGVAVATAFGDVTALGAVLSGVVGGALLVVGTRQALGSHSGDHRGVEG